MVNFKFAYLTFQFTT